MGALAGSCLAAAVAGLLGMAGGVVRTEPPELPLGELSSLVASASGAGLAGLDAGALGRQRAAGHRGSGISLRAGAAAGNQERD